MGTVARGPVALVLAGGAALGAYEVGVVQHLVDDVARDLGRDLSFELILGTSAGALNAAFLASHADAPRERGQRLAALWTSLRLRDVLKPSGAQLLGMLLDNFAAVPEWLVSQRGGVLDRRRLEAIFRRATPMTRIDEHLAAGRLRGVSLAATHVATGKCTSFVQTHAPLAPWPADPLATVVATRLRAPHALASAAIPLLFPAVKIDGEWYCDGGLRQVVPLSAALHLGARALVVVNPVGTAPAEPVAPATGQDLVSPIYLAGKALNALFLDRMEVDLARVQQINQVLAAGRRRFGARFVDELNRELAGGQASPLGEVALLRLQPSRDIGRLAAEYVASDDFGERDRGLAGLCLRLVGHGDRSGGGDLLSYLLFDGGFAARLIELGRADARARHAELCRFFAELA